MFLSKIFSIFKKKKDNPNEASSDTGTSTPTGAVIPPSSGAIGTAVGLSQPTERPVQAPDLSTTQVAEAPQDPLSSPPSFGGGVEEQPAAPSDSLGSADAPSVDDSSLGGDPSQPASDIVSPLPDDQSTDSSSDSLPPAPDTSPTEPPISAPQPDAPLGAVPPADDPLAAAPSSDDSQNIAV